jgi:NAD(P)-dependent dehydrogenase (short-subunit alcohol dehydrogenase family)
MTDILFDVSKKCVLITGVSGQIGSEYAKAFLSRGSFVYGLDVVESDRSVEIYRKYPNSYHFIRTNVADRNSIIAAAKIIRSESKIPTVLINNAAIDSPPSSANQDNGAFEDYPEEAWDRVMDVNLKGMFMCCQVFGGDMVKTGAGSIINISSIYGVVSPDQSIYEYRRKRGEKFFKPVAYSASKSGVLNLTRYLAVYWAKSNIRVNSLTIAGVLNNQENDFIESYCNRIPVGRMADSTEYNGAVIFLASDASRYMTGHNMVVDGGWTAI